MSGLLSKISNVVNTNPADLIYEIELRDKVYVDSKNAEERKERMFRNLVGGNLRDITYLEFYEQHLGNAKISIERQRRFSVDDLQWLEDIGLGVFLSDENRSKVVKKIP